MGIEPQEEELIRLVKEGHTIKELIDLLSDEQEQHDIYANTGIVMPDFATLIAALKAYEEMKDAKENNTLHISPCPDGTEIYTIKESDRDLSCRLMKESYLTGVTEYTHGEFNKDWFLSMEEASQRVIQINTERRCD